MPLIASPAWVQQATSHYANILDKASLPVAGAIIKQMFEKAKSESDIRNAEALWTKYQDKVVDYEKSLDCYSYGSSGDNDIAMSIVDDLVNRPVSLMIAVGDLILTFAQQDKDEIIKSFEDAVKELKKERVGKGVDKTKDKVARLSEPAARRFKEALLRWLQAYSKRSRKHFVQIVDDIVGIATGIGGLAWRTGKLFNDSGITPDACGSVRSINQERSLAVQRVFLKEINQTPATPQLTLGRPR